MPSGNRRNSPHGERARFVAFDLFSGSGGLTRGLRDAGFRIGAAVEIDGVAAKTYKKNHRGVQVLQKDVREVTGEELLRTASVTHVDLLAGCAPCQGFCSLTRKNSKPDPRNALILEMARLVEELKPTAVFMENVPGLATRGNRLFKQFISRLKALKYQVNVHVVQMADYGVPQYRRRLVLLAGKGFDIPLPSPTHARVPEDESVKPWVTLKETIKGLPAPVTMKKAVALGGPHKFEWHVVRNLQPQTLARLKAATPGKTWLHVDETLRPECHQGSYEGFMNTYGRMTWQQPSVTITSGCTTPAKGRFGHPNKTRTTISVREAALLQTFPRTYEFAAPYIDQTCEMIGNAVPPHFAGVIGRSVRAALVEQHEVAGKP